MNQIIKERISQIQNGIVPEGYKQTDFGIFPEDWETGKTLKDLGKFGKGKGLPGDKLIESGVPCVGYGDIYMKYTYFFNQSKSFTDEKTASESAPVAKGTLLFTGTGETPDEIGKCVCYNGNETIYAGGDIITFVPNEVNPMFLAYQQYQSFSLSKKYAYGQGHSVVHIHKEELSKLPVAYPKSESEQKRIADILEKWDKAIELQEQLIEKLEIQKSCVIQNMLKTQKDWIKVRFSDLYEYASEGGTPSTKNNDYYIGGTIPFVKIEHLSKKYIETIDSYITEKGLQNSGAWLVPVNSVIYSNGATIGEVSINRIPVATKQGILGIVPTKEYSAEFLYYWLQSLQIKKLIHSLTTKGTMPTVYLKDLSKSYVYVPTKDGREKISAYISLLDSQKELLNDKLDVLKQQQKSMQQLLLTGIVRV